MKKFVFRTLINLANWFAPKGDQSISIDEAYAPQVANPVASKDLNSQVTCGVTVRKAMNGKVLELSQWKPNQVAAGRLINNTGGDWVQTLYVLKDGERLDEAVTTLLVTQALDR